MTVSCYQPDDERPRVRPLRLVPVAARGIYSGGRERSDAVSVTQDEVVGRVGVEPTTNGLKARCSTN